MGREYKLNGKIEIYDLEKFQESLFIFLQESDHVGNFSVDFELEEE